jgi:1,4-alpha-glucan branching enzyme
MGWMHDTLRYLQRQPIHRKFHHNELTFRSLYAFSESFMMPLSHDEVVHGKGSLLRKMPGTTWQKMATLRLLYGYMFGQSGKKMMFMGSEFGMRKEWNHDGELSWNLLGDAGHQGICHWVGQLNRLLQTEPALHDNDHDPTGFHWLQANDAEHSVYVFCRVPRQIDASPIVIVCNATPVVREAYTFAVPSAGEWQIIANSDDTDYGGAGIVTHEPDTLLITEEATTRQEHTLTLTVPALSVLFLKPVASTQSKDNQEQTK